MNNTTPRRPGSAFMALVLILALPLTAGAAERALESVKHTQLSGEEVELTLQLSGPAPEPNIFTVDQPARLSLDLPDTRLAVSERYQNIDAGPIRAVALAEGGNRTRMVVEMTRLVDYDVTVDGNTVRLRLGSDTRQRAATEPAAATPAPTPGDKTEGAHIKDIDFRRSETGAGRVVVTVEGLRGGVDVSEEGGKIVARFPGAQVPERLVKRLDVIDFATPVKYIDMLPRDGSTKLVITPIQDADFEQIAYQTGNQFTIELQPLTTAEIKKQQQEKPKYTGERISLSFQNVDVRALLQIIADVADVNMVVSDSVSGTMALRLQNVPWDQALDIILKSKGLGMRREGNVISVAPLAEIAAREKAELEAQQATTNLAPLRSEIIQINYARASEMAALIRSGEDSLLSQRGQVIVDERTNTLLINETREKLGEIRRLIERLDIPVRQVLIESRIVVANKDFSRNLGVTLSAQDQAAIGNFGSNKLVNSGFAVNLPVAGAAGTMTTSIIGDTFNLDLALSALQAENKGEIISRPRVITSDGREAQIDQGVEIPFLEAASSGAATVSFKEAVLSLRVTPQITPDKRIVMDLFVTQDSIGENVNVQGGGQVPSIDTRSVSTQVLVNDGETVVLGGIYGAENRETQTKVPVLGDLPLLGAFFRNTSTTATKSELLIFISPNILSEKLKLQ